MMDKELKKAKRTFWLDVAHASFQGAIALSALLLSTISTIDYDQRTYLLALGLYPMLLFLKLWGEIDKDKEKADSIKSKATEKVK